MATCVRSYSKINLGLVIGPVRADGFHGLTTLYQTLGLHDLVTVSAKRLANATEAERANWRFIGDGETPSRFASTTSLIVSVPIVYRLRPFPGRRQLPAPLVRRRDTVGRWNPLSIACL